MTKKSHILSGILVTLVVIIMANLYIRKHIAPTVHEIQFSHNNDKQSDIAPFKHLGDHIIAEFTGAVNCNATEELKTVLREAAEEAGATVLSVTTHQFEPQGMTGVAVLQESHISVHTWPEYGYVSIDVYTCGDHILIDKAIDRLKKFFCPKRVVSVNIKRGFFPEEEK